MEKLTPAQYVVKTFGGVRKTARAIGIEPSAVCRWRQPKAKNGTDGLIPTVSQQRVLVAARMMKLDITAEDLIIGRTTKK